MTQTPATRAIDEQGPLDDQGRLMHEDDLAAQLALSLARLEATLAAAGLGPTDLVELCVRTTDASALRDVYDVLTERLDATGATPVTTTVEVARFAVPGMLVALRGLATDGRPFRRDSSEDRRPTT